MFYKTGKFHIYSLVNKDFAHCWIIDVLNMWFFQNNSAPVLFWNDNNTEEQGLTFWILFVSGLGVQCGAMGGDHV